MGLSLGPVVRAINVSRIRQPPHVGGHFDLFSICCGALEYVMSDYNDNRLLNRAQVEEQFGIPVRFLELAVTRREGPPLVRLGRSVRYRTGDIRKWLESQVEGGGNG